MMLSYKVEYYFEFATKDYNALDKIPEMFVNCKQSSYYVAFLIHKRLIFFSFAQPDLVNTKTTIPLPAGSEYSARYIFTTIHLPFGE